MAVDRSFRLLATSNPAAALHSIKISAIVPASGGMQAAIPAQGTRAALWHPAGLTPPQGPSPRTDDDDLKRPWRFPRVFLQTNRDLADLREVGARRSLPSAEGA